MAQEIVLYDLPSKDPCKSWSLNPWKTRLLLNFKGIPYKTIWLEYPEIEPFCKSVGIPPHNSGNEIADYTLPIVKFLDGRYIMHSQEIASELEKFYPEPSLHIDVVMLEQLQTIIRGSILRYGALFIVGTSKNLLREESKGYFDRERGKRYGPLEQVERETDVEEMWERVGDGLRQIGTKSRANSEGPFLEGQRVSAGDFVIVGFMQWFRRIDVGFYERAVAIEPSLGVLYDSCQTWLEKDD